MLHWEATTTQFINKRTPVHTACPLLFLLRALLYGDTRTEPLSQVVTSSCASDDASKPSSVFTKYCNFHSVKPRTQESPQENRRQLISNPVGGRAGSLPNSATKFVRMVYGVGRGATTRQHPRVGRAARTCGGVSSKKN